MLKIGIIVGRVADVAPKTAYLKKVPKDLRTEDNEVPSDVAIAYYIKTNYPNVIVDIITPEDISLKRLNQNDFVYVMYDLIDAYNEGGIDLFLERKRIYSRTKAIIYPTLKMQKLIISKSKYYTLLKQNNIPIAPFINITKSMYLRANDKLKIANSLLKKIASYEWPGVILKPELGSYGTGIKLFSDIKKLTPKKLKAYLDKSFKKDEFQAILIQRFMEDFPKYYEVRTYWINGEYKYSVGTIIDYSTLGTGDEELFIDTPVAEGGTIPDNIISEMKRLGTEIVKVVPKMYDSENLLLRLDWGCCQVKDDRTIEQPEMCKKYFLNEIELTPNLFAIETNFPMIEEFGDALVAKAYELV